MQPLRRHRPDLHQCRLPVQDVSGGRRLSGHLSDLGRVVLLPDVGAARLPDSLLGVQLPAGVRELELPLLRPASDPLQPDEALRRPALHLPTC
jgi:hypothetical protein